MKKMAVSKEAGGSVCWFCDISYPDITRCGKVAMWLADSASQIKAVAAEEDATTCQG